MFMPTMPPPIITMSALVIRLVPHYGNSEAIGVVIVHRQNKRDKVWVAGNAFIILENTGHSFILRLLECSSAAHTVVCHDNAAGSAQAECPVEVLGVGGLVSIDKDEVEGCFTLQLWKQVERFANTYLGAISNARFGK